MSLNDLAYYASENLPPNWQIEFRLHQFNGAVIVVYDAQGKVFEEYLVSDDAGQDFIDAVNAAPRV